MTCPQCRAADRELGPATARADLQRYHRRGPDRTTRAILEALRKNGPPEATLLDVGAGVGVICHERLAGGAAGAGRLEAAAAYLETAGKEAERRGHADRLRLVSGDLVEVAEGLPAADLVTLDRVLCCYPDLEPLVAASTRLARRLWAASYPLDRWYVRAVVWLQNLGRRLTRSDFRTWVHPTADLDRLLAAAGFVETFRRNGLVWRTTAHARRDRGAARSVAVGRSR